MRDTVNQLKELCESQGVEGFNLTNQDIVDFITGDINDIFSILKKLIKLLPITPISAEDSRQIYENACHVLASA